MFDTIGCMLAISFVTRLKKNTTDYKYIHKKVKYKKPIKKFEKFKKRFKKRKW